MGRTFPGKTPARVIVFRSLVLLTVGTALAACQSPAIQRLTTVSRTEQHGYIVAPNALKQVPVGSSREQVLVALGTPSTTLDFNGEVFYYISQTTQRLVAFTNPKIVDQRVIAVYFGPNGRVQRVADYGLQDGRVFDFVSRTTPTSGKDQTFIQEVFAANVAPSGSVLKPAGAQ
ncbi:MAG: outer membrane protein assembly factor BamE [Bauldia sp.]